MNIPKHIRFLFAVYLWGLLFFTLFRVAIFCTQIKAYQQLPDERISLIAKSFFMGWRFDTCISAYLLSLPLVVMSVMAFLKFGRYNKREVHPLAPSKGGDFLLSKKLSSTTSPPSEGAQRVGNTPKYLTKTSTVATWFLSVMYVFAFAICVVDIPYYDFFQDRLNSAAFNWIDTPDFVIGMILEEPIHFLYIGGFCIACFLFIKKIFSLKKRLLYDDWRISIRYLPFILVVMGLTFLGIRGRIDEKSPIRVGTAAFSPYALPNDIGLNPVFTLMRSLLDDQKTENRAIQFMDNQEAIQLTRKYLNVPDSTDFDSPIARPFEPEGESIDANIVVVLMESMSAAKMGIYGNPYDLTPSLDSLAREGLFFKNCYTAGIHTYNGLYSTLYGFPALMKQHSLDIVNVPQYAGIPNTLRAQGYRTAHFMTHDDQFDNVGGFFQANGYERVFSENDYPQKEVKSTLGVPDHIMFEYAVPILNDYANEGNFFASFMTTSDHIPYIIPDDIPFKPKQSAKELAIIEYTDWSIRHFIELCKKEAWFDRTIFIFLADHGRPANDIYDMPLSYHHSPLIFYSPGLLIPSNVNTNFALQQDVFPTIMSILNRPFINNTLGINLLKEKRSYAYFSADTKYGCLSDNYFLVVRDDGNESLYDYKNRNTHNFLIEKKATAAEMKRYTEAMLQTTQWMILNGKTGQEMDKNKMSN